MATLTESIIEDAAVVQLATAGVPLRIGSDLADAGLAPERGLIGSLLRDAILRLNPQLAGSGGDKAAVEQVVRTLRAAPHLTFLGSNNWFHQQAIGDRDYPLPRLLSGVARVHATNRVAEEVG